MPVWHKSKPAKKTGFHSKKAASGHSSFRWSKPLFGPKSRPHQYHHRTIPVFRGWPVSKATNSNISHKKVKKAACREGTGKDPLKTDAHSMWDLVVTKYLNLGESSLVTEFGIILKTLKLCAPKFRALFDPSRLKLQSGGGPGEIEDGALSALGLPHTIPLLTSQWTCQT